MKYVCDLGYVFVENPVAVNTDAPTTTTTPGPTTTTVSMDWKTFKDAQYALGYDSSADSWQIARDMCKSAGGDLATIQSWEVQKFINDQFGTNYNIWIGASRTSTSAAWTWANGVNWEYKYWNNCNYGNDLCVKIDKNENGRWEDIDCATSNIPRYLCQKGTSSSTMWVRIHGAEYAYMEDDDCFDDWTDARDRCQSYTGANIASILSQEVQDALSSYITPQWTDDYFIGLHDRDTEGTFVWQKGEKFDWTNWAKDEPGSWSSTYDCVKVEDDAGEDQGKWKVDVCNFANIEGVLCMKGTSTSVQTSGGLGVVGRKKRLVSQAEDTKLPARHDGQDSRERTTNQTVKHNTQTTNGPVYSRAKRSIDTDPMYSRTIKCEPLFGGSHAHWKYDYEVPEYCFSKRLFRTRNCCLILPISRSELH